MKAARVQLKLYLEPGTLPDPERAVPVFHAWIRERVLPELLVDVARYGHVPNGPAVMLIGHATDYAIDTSEGRPGLSVTQKRRRDPVGARELLVRAFSAAARLEADLSEVRFRSDELRLVALDRLNHPNTDSGFQAFVAELEPDLTALLGPSTLEREGGPREALRARLSRGRNEPVAELVKRLAQSS